MEETLKNNELESGGYGLRKRFSGVLFDLNLQEGGSQERVRWRPFQAGELQVPTNLALELETGSMCLTPCPRS